MQEQTTLEELRQQIIAERETAINQEAQARLQAQQAREQRAANQAWAELERASGDYRPVYKAAQSALNDMLAAFDSETVSFAELRTAHEQAVRAFTAAIDFAEAAVTTYFYGGARSTWSRVPASGDAHRAFRLFDVPVSPFNALVRWCADTSGDLRAWRVALVVAFYPQFFDIRQDWPNEGFDPQRATEADLQAQRFRGAN